MVALEKQHVQNDGRITIAVGKSRHETKWTNTEMDWSQLVEKLMITKRTKETIEEYHALPKDKQGDIKDVGGFVGGVLQGGRRKAGSVPWRWLITLDADFVEGKLWERVQSLIPHAVMAYPTHAHTAEQPRIRLVAPLTRPVSPDEYQAVSRLIAADLGIDQFDDTTYEPHRLMYWPSTPKDGKYVPRYQDGPWVNPDEYLARYQDWRDVSQWPVSSRITEVRHADAEKQGDPLAKDGVIGAFCRTYRISEAIERFLSDIYEPAGEGRYTFKSGSTLGGLAVYDHDTFAFSHHSTDPACGRLLNAFDLVRIHKYGQEDNDASEKTFGKDLPSFKSMLQFAEFDDSTQETIAEERENMIDSDETLETGDQYSHINARKLFFDKSRFVPAFFGEWYIRRNSCLVASDRLFIYRDGVYTPGDKIFEREAATILGAEYGSTRVTETLKYIKSVVTETSTDDLTSDDKHIIVKNGVLNLESLELLPHSPEFHSIIKLPVEYDPKARCPNIDRFIMTVVPVDCEPILEEMVGYCLTSSMRIEKAFVLRGDGQNGKSTFLRIVETLFGPENLSFVPLQSFGEDKFATADLYGKIANIHADLPNLAVGDSSVFKELVSGDSVRAQEKYLPSFKFRNRAKLIFAANEIPVSRDNSYGFHRRLVIIPFPRIFDNPELRSKLFSDGEISGFFNRALRGLRRLIKQEGLTQSDTVAALTAEYQARSDTVYRFVQSYCVVSDGAKVRKQEVYDSYRSACADWGNQAVNQAQFNARLRALLPEVSEFRKTGVRQWRNLVVFQTDFPGDEAEFGDD